MFIPRKTDKLTGLTKKEYDSITRLISKKELSEKLKEVKKINKKFKRITSKEAIDILNKNKKR